MTRRMLITAVIALFVCGCATYQNTSRLRMESLPQHYSQFDLQLGWDTRVADGKTLVEGMVKNVRYQMMYDLEIRVAALDSKGKPTVHAVAFVIPSQLPMDDTAPFRLKLPAELLPGTRLRFTYSYRGSDTDAVFGEGLNGGQYWFQTFDAVVPGARPR